MKQMAQMAAETMGLPILEPVNVEGMPRPIAINKDVCIVGARSEVNLRLSSPLVSRTHAMFVADRDSIYLRDLASRNHTYLNDKPIRDAVLRNGDVIGLGPLSFRCKSGFDKPYDPTEIHAPPAELRPAKDGQRVPLNTRSTLIGSRNDCDVVLPGKDVEPSHAIIFEREGHRYIRDLRTVSGTWVNESVVGQTELSPGDEIRIGDAQFVYQLTEAAEMDDDTDGRPLEPEPMADAAEVVVGDEDEDVELELADSTVEAVSESVGLSDWDEADLLAGRRERNATEATDPLLGDSLDNGAMDSKSSENATAPAEERAAPAPAADGDAIPIRLEDLSDEPVAVAAPVVRPAIPVEADVQAELPEAVPVASPPENAAEAPSPPTAPIQVEEPMELAHFNAGPALPADASHPGQQDRLAPEEKLTELLGELAGNIAEVQATWEEVRSKQAEAPHWAHPGADAGGSGEGRATPTSRKDHAV
jgi:pSer/pThr/pTyr-binding forkhead associated (FHA) protein